MAECGLDFQETYRGFRLPVAYARYSSRLRIRYRRTKHLAFPPVAGNGRFPPAVSQRQFELIRHWLPHLGSCCLA